jgi:hypothetical protein
MSGGEGLRSFVTPGRVLGVGLALVIALAFAVSASAASLSEFNSLARKVAKRIAYIHAADDYDYDCQRDSSRLAFCRLSFYGYESGAEDCTWVIRLVVSGSYLRSRYVSDNC